MTFSFQHLLNHLNQFFILVKKAIHYFLISVFNNIWPKKMTFDFSKTYLKSLKQYVLAFKPKIIMNLKILLTKIQINLSAMRSFFKFPILHFSNYCLLKGKHLLLHNLFGFNTVFCMHLQLFHHLHFLMEQHITICLKNQ